MKLFGLSTFARTGLCAGIILLLSAPAVPAGSIAKNGTNIRSGPSLKAEVLLIVPRGYPIEVQEPSGEWTRFRDWQGNTAWVSTSLVSDVKTAVILTDRANIRTADATDATVATVAEVGEIYKVLSKKGDWVQLGYYNTGSPVGWIRHDLVFGE